MSHWRMEFNNYCQKNGLTQFVQWQESRAGPQNAPSWTVRVFFNGAEYGRGSATTVAAARDLASEQALRALWAQRGD